MASDGDLEKFICRGSNLNSEWEHFVRLPVVNLKCGHYACRRCIGFIGQVHCNLCKQFEVAKDVKMFSNNHAECMIKNNIEGLSIKIYEKLEVLGDKINFCELVCLCF